MKFETIDQIKAHQFVGNHAGDSEAFRAIEMFILSPGSIEDRAEAIRQMSDRGMGLGRIETHSDEEIVNDYLMQG